MKGTILPMVLAVTLGCSTTPEVRRAAELEQEALELHGMFSGYEQRALRQLTQGNLSPSEDLRLREALYQAVVMAGPTIETAIDLREFTAHEANNMSHKYKQSLERISRNLEFWIRQFEPKVNRLRAVTRDSDFRHQPE